MDGSFKIENSNRGALANLTLSVGFELAVGPLSSATKQRLAESLIAEAAAQGFALRYGVAIDVQTNWLSAGADVTVATYVAKARRSELSSTACEAVA